MKPVLCLLLLTWAAGSCLAAEETVAGKTLTQWQTTLSSSEAIERRQAAATLAAAGFPARDMLRQTLQSEDEVVRQWAMLGLSNLAEERRLTREERTAIASLCAEHLEDASPIVRGTAAQAVARYGDQERGVALLIKLTEHPQPAVATHALTMLDSLGDAGRPHSDRIKAIAQTGTEYPKRLAERMLKRWQ